MKYWESSLTTTLKALGGWWVIKTTFVVYALVIDDFASLVYGVIGILGGCVLIGWAVFDLATGIKESLRSRNNRS